MKRQSKQSKISIKSVLCVLLLIVGIGTFSSMSLNATIVSYEPSSYSSLIPHDPIEIISDSGLEVFPGSGTAEDPYVIEGYNITTTSTSGISIKDTTKHFIVRNCYVDSGGSGIYIYNAAAGTATVINNTCNDNGRGIYLHYSGDSTVFNNTCCNNDYGIRILHSDSSTVANNTCNNSGWYGITLGSDSCTIANNTCNNNFYCGIRIDGSILSTVINNTCSNNNHWGIFFYASSGNSTVINNTCSYNEQHGIILDDSGNSIVSNNTCNNHEYSGIILLSSGSSTVANNTCNNTTNIGICLDDSGSSTVSNNTCRDNGHGIHLSSSDLCNITNNLLQENKIFGVQLEVSDDCIIHHNNFVDNKLEWGGPQGCDDGNNNTWYDTATLEGNYWSDWSGTGSYSIEGEAEAFDLYPLDEPTVFLDPPVISDIIHSPSSPTELDTIIINAIVTNPQGVLSVTLHYRINAGTWTEISMTLISVDLYSGTIGDSFAVSDTIEYYISAVDKSANNNEATEDNGGLYYVLTIGSSDVSSPIIADIIHSPATPTELDTVSINATVTDSSGVQSTTLYYRINGGAWLTISMTLVSGDLYSGTIGPFPFDYTIEYYITAIDNSVNHNEAIENNNGQYYNIFVGSSDVIGPSIIGINHSPSTPIELDTVNINATVTDSSGVQSVTLHYRVNGGTWQTISMTLVSGDLYSGTIGGSFAVDDTIEYYISSIDNSISHNFAINDNSGEYYSFTVHSSGDETMSVMFSLLLPAITFLFLGFGIVVQQRRKSE